MATYFIQSGGMNGPIKIGTSRDPLSRLAKLQCGNPEQLTIVATLDEELEKAFHELLTTHRISGEWFSFSAIPWLARLAQHEVFASGLMLPSVLSQMAEAGAFKVRETRSQAFDIGEALAFFDDLFCDDLRRGAGE